MLCAIAKFHMDSCNNSTKLPTSSRDLREAHLEEMDDGWLDGGAVKVKKVAKEKTLRQQLTQAILRR